MWASLDAAASAFSAYTANLDYFYAKWDEWGLLTLWVLDARPLPPFANSKVLAYKNDNCRQ